MIKWDTENLDAFYCEARTKIDAHNAVIVILEHEQAVSAELRNDLREAIEAVESIVAFFPDLKKLDKVKRLLDRYAGRAGGAKRGSGDGPEIGG